jgi:NAD(P)-dependent dehydrogenase (short-subunit alcohol dehydrogenase family)
MPFSLQRATLVVVGGTSGIGLEIARAASALEARVIAVGRSEAHIRETQEALGDRATVRRADIGDEHAVRTLFEEITAVTISS